MHNWLPEIDRDAALKYAVPKYTQIADAIAGAVHSGELRPGQRLPPQRELARQLGVDLTTVTRAYGLARDAGLIEGAGKLGSFVRNDIAPPRFGETASEAGMNVPPQPASNLLPEAIRTGTAALLRAGRHSPILQYQPSLGNMADRQVAAQAMTDRGLPSDAARIVIAAGAQHALQGIAASALRPGGRIACPRFIYPGMLALARRHDIALEVVESDGEGLLPDALDQALRSGASAIYLTPTNDNPTAVTMSEARRRDVAALAQRHEATIIEDDAYGLLPARPPLPLATLAPERTWHIASTSKVISPVLRVAHVRAPSAEAAQRLAGDFRTTAIMAPPLNAALVTSWLRDGTFGELVAGVRTEAIARQRIATRHLAGLEWRAHPEGYHLWLAVPAPARAGEIAAEISAMGLSLVPGADFDVLGNGDAPHLRLSLGGAIDHGRLALALERLRAMLLEQE